MMGIIVCQHCSRGIDHFDGEKVMTLYTSACKHCKSRKNIKR
ncbi:GapA-binding peptide SR1P [Salibacterium sp. K-3]